MAHARGAGHLGQVGTVLEIETAIEKLPLPEKREVFDFLAEPLGAEASEPGFPDLKALLLEIPGVGTDEDFARLSEAPGGRPGSLSWRTGFCWG